MPRKVKLDQKPVGRPPGDKATLRSVRCLVSLRQSEADALSKPLASSIYDIVKSHLRRMQEDGKSSTVND